MDAPKATLQRATFVTSRVRKIVPARSALDAAYRQFRRGVHIQKLIDAELAKPDKAPVPKDLGQRVRAYLAEHPEVPWDVAVARIVREG